MPQGPDGKTIIIVKKVAGHGGHHGGSWKVAFADFVTSMMCLFMVLWLVNSASAVTRERIASYFKRPGVFDIGSGAPLELQGGGILPDAHSPPAEGTAATTMTTEIYDKEENEGHKDSGYPGGMQQERAPAQSSATRSEQQESFEKTLDAIKELKREDQMIIAGLIGEVAVKLDQRGLHLEIMDTDKVSMFASGSAQMSPAAEAELRKIASLLLKLPNPMDIEGHTDARPFRSGTARNYDNWNLSTDRANAARRVLQSVGVKENQISRVVGFAAQRPRVPGDPFAPSNRRISISMRYTDQAAGALGGHKFTETQNGLIVTPEMKAGFVEIFEESGENRDESEREISREILPSSSGLKVELKTTLPEGTAVQQLNEAAPRPPWMEKDKIFGGENPFAVR